MIKYIPNLLLVFLFGTFLTTACNVTEGQNLSADPDANILYANSFENEEDISDWQETGGIQLREESPGGGGMMSAFVSGGCVHPHSMYEFSSPTRSTLRLKAWAKNLGIGGGILLHNKTTDDEIYISVEDKEWKKLHSEQSLSVSRGDKLQLSMSAGGFAPSSMLVTLVEIERVR